MLREPRGIVLAPEASCDWFLTPSRCMAAKESAMDSGSMGWLF